MKISLRLFALLLVTLLSLQSYGSRFDFDFTVGELCYTILSEDDATVEVSRLVDFETSAIEIPANVFYNGKNYTVTGIGESAFGSCKNLADITIPGSVKELCYRAFCGCDALETITIPEGVTTIHDEVFLWSDNLSQILLPKSLTTIGDYAFSGCPSLTSLTIPESVTEIGGGIVTECPALEEIKIAPGNYNFIMSDGVLYNSHHTKVFAALSKTTEVQLPASVTEIGKSAFERCNRLTKINLSNSILSIGEKAFYFCSELQEVKLPNSVLKIGSEAFWGCIRIKSITIPQSVSKIGDGAFAMGYLENIEVHPWNKTFASIDGVLYNKELTTLLQCAQKKESVDIPNSVENIADFAFESCGYLKSVDIPNSVSNIGKSAFQSCSSLETINIPPLVTVIESSSFEFCSSLKNIIIPDHIVAVGAYAFDGCEHATTLSISASINYLGWDSFSYCNGLTTILMHRREPLEVSIEIAEEVYSTATLYIPIGTKSAYSTVKPWKNFANIVETDFAGVETPTAEKTENLRIGVNSDTVTIEGVEDGEEIAIYDMSGRLIRTGKEHTFAGLARGIYIVKAGAKTAKFTM